MSHAAANKVYIKIESAEEQQVIATMASMFLSTKDSALKPITNLGMENLKNQRKTLKVLQETATDKENLTGRSQIDKLLRLKSGTETTLACIDNPKRKKLETRVAETQTSPQKNEKNKLQITAEDLTGEATPSEGYYERLAETRRSALEETLTENQRLHERIEGLEAELDTSQSLLREAQNLVEILTDMLNEAETDNVAEIEEHKSEQAETADEETQSSKSSDNE